MSRPHKSYHTWMSQVKYEWIFFFHITHEWVIIVWQVAVFWWTFFMQKGKSFFWGFTVTSRVCDMIHFRINLCVWHDSLYVCDTNDFTCDTWMTWYVWHMDALMRVTREWPYMCDMSALKWVTWVPLYVWHECPYMCDMSALKWVTWVPLYVWHECP